MENRIKETLEKLNSATRAGNTDEVLSSIKDLDKLRVELRSSLNPQLVHFLEKRSYAKAYALLGGEGENIPRGACGAR